MMFTDPGFVVAVVVEMLDEREVAVDLLGGILVRGVKRRDEDTESKRTLTHDKELLRGGRGRLLFRDP